MRSAIRSTLGVLDRLNAVIYLGIGGLLAMIVIVVLLQVIVRFVLTSLGINIAAPWTEEMARYFLIWLIFLGAAVGCRKMQLISLEFVTKGTPAAVGMTMRYVALVLCLVLFLIMLRYGVEFVQVIGRSEMSPVMQIPKTWVYWAMPAGAALMIVNTLAFIAESWVEGRDIRQSGGLADEA
jgi:TRAP-type C4-dicarboxylate transport system permease small subunit